MQSEAAQSSQASATSTPFSSWDSSGLPVRLTARRNPVRTLSRHRSARWFCGPSNSTGITIWSPAGVAPRTYSTASTRPITSSGSHFSAASAWFQVNTGFLRKLPARQPDGGKRVPWRSSTPVFSTNRTTRLPSTGPWISAGKVFWSGGICLVGSW